MYQVTVIPRPQRQQEILELEKASKTTVVSYDVYEGKPTSLTEIIVPIDLPVYRMANGRTQTAQYHHIHEKGLDESFFANGEENQTVQQAQHAILAKMANERRESIASIIDELKRRKQTEPILITPYGQVVNGNRRLAAIRELSTQDSQSADSFRDVRCAILPPLNPLQIDELEMRLQMSPETKLPYSWVNEALKIRRLIQQEQTEQEVARMMNRQQRTVRKTLQALNYADIYLKEWKHEPQNYDLVEDGRQFFYDLVQNLEEKKGSELDISMKIAFALFDGPRKGRLYNFNPVLKDHAKELIDRIAEDASDQPADNKGGDSSSDDPLLITFETSSEPSSVTKVNAFLQNGASAEEVSEIVTEAARTLLERQNNEQSGRRALNIVREARDSLKELDLTTADPKTHKQIMVILEALEDRIHDMQAVLRGLRVSGS